MDIFWRGTIYMVFSQNKLNKIFYGGTRSIELNSNKSNFYCNYNVEGKNTNAHTFLITCIL